MSIWNLFRWKKSQFCECLTTVLILNLLDIRIFLKSYPFSDFGMLFSLSLVNFVSGKF